MTESTNPMIEQENINIPWETRIRSAFEKSAISPDDIQRELASKVLELDKLNKFCFEIAPEITKKLVTSADDKLQGLEFRLWSSTHPGHVSVFAIDKSHQKAYLVDAAGLLNKDRPDDSPLGITVFTPKDDHQLYGNASIEQFISKPYTSDTPGLGEIQTEEEMESIPLKSMQQLFN